MTIKTTATEKGMIEYCLHGQGRTILIIHGGHINCREAIFQKRLDPNKFCFLTPSRPGYGNTPLTETNKTPKQAAELYVALLDKLQKKRVTVIGISAGGLTALEIAANFPDRVDNLVLMSALTKKWFTETDKTYRSSKIIFNPKIERITWLFYKLFFSLLPKSMTRIMFKALSKYRPVQYTQTEFHELKQMIINMRSGQGFYNDLDQNIDQEILQKIVCPTLIVHSNTDNQVDVSHAQNAKDKIKNSNLTIFNNRWGHMLWFGDEYELVLAKLKSFV
ncbi:MAG: alpha/beta hydrolase [Cytophagales bacterium]|nr:alpha/beta hydrolase [Cytophagales bacterium]